MLIPVCAGSDAPAPTTTDLVHSGLGWPRKLTMSGVRFACVLTVGVTTNDTHDSEWGAMLPKWETQGTMRSSDGNALTVGVAANDPRDSEWGAMLPKWETQETTEQSADGWSAQAQSSDDAGLTSTTSCGGMLAGTSHNHPRLFPHLFGALCLAVVLVRVWCVGTGSTLRHRPRRPPRMAALLVAMVFGGLGEQTYVEATPNGVLDENEFKLASWEWVQNTATATTKWGDIGDWDTSGVADFSRAFSVQRDEVGRAWVNNGNPKAATATLSAISKWTTTSLVKLHGTFDGAKAMNADLSGWSTAKVTSLKITFNDATAFTGKVNE